MNWGERMKGNNRDTRGRRRKETLTMRKLKEKKINDSAQDILNTTIQALVETNERKTVINLLTIRILCEQLQEYNFKDKKEMSISERKRRTKARKVRLDEIDEFWDDWDDWDDGDDD